MKKLEIEKTKPTFIISTIKTDMIKVGLVFSISNFSTNKIHQENNWSMKKIPSSKNLALVVCQKHNNSLLEYVFSFNKNSKYQKLKINVGLNPAWKLQKPISFHLAAALEWPRLWRITDLSLVGNKLGQRTMKMAMKIFLAFPSF